MNDYPEAIQAVLKSTRPLVHDRGGRMPLLLWPVQGGEVKDEAMQEAIIRDLDARGISMIATWNFSEDSIEDSLRVARIQQRLGLPVYINAIAPMYEFYNGDPSTAHRDEAGQPFFDLSIKGRDIGCPFQIEHRYDELTEQIDVFVRAYHQAGLLIDFVFGDWEVDGPLEVNRAWEASKRCTICREKIADIESFDAFQAAVRIERSRATRRCYVEPILSRYPKALVGNYGVYPHDGYRYWYDYFEEFVDYHPHRMDQHAPYRKWYDDFPLTGYTFAMPVIYPWARNFLWYDFESADYRWFYSMLKVASNAGAHTSDEVPIVPFVHFETIYEPDPNDDSIKQMSRFAYEELIWHTLLRGTDTLFLWCRASKTEIEVPPLHEVWAASLAYRDWLQYGRPVIFEVPQRVGPVVSAVKYKGKLLVRRTDFDDDHPSPVKIEVDGQSVSVARNQGVCQVIPLR